MKKKTYIYYKYNIFNWNKKVFYFYIKVKKELLRLFKIKNVSKQYFFISKIKIKINYKIICIK